MITRFRNRREARRKLAVMRQMMAELQSHGGILRCHVCQAEQPLGDTGRHTAHGWPECCGETMPWITQRLLDEETRR
jgi:hypothetical protein